MPRILGQLLQTQREIVNGPNGSFESVTLHVLEDVSPGDRPQLLGLRVGRDFGPPPPDGSFVDVQAVASAYSGRHGAGIQWTALRLMSAKQPTAKTA